jgi:histone deacetylase complex regulatory component SIN3
MKEFKSQEISTQKVIQHVSKLFAGAAKEPY